MLRFGSGKIDDESLKSVKDFKNLKRLVFNRCNLTDASIQNIAKGASFKMLDISNNPKITGDALKYLAPLKLDYINLRETNVSISALRDYYKNHQCKIVMPRMQNQYSKEQLKEISKIRADIVFDFDHRIQYADVKTIFGSVNRK
jgi:hypothetical protein